MAQTEPVFPIQLIFLIVICPVLYDYWGKIEKEPDLFQIDFNYLFKSCRIYSGFDLSTSHFIICYFGQQKIDNTGQFRKYLHSVATIIPGATVVFGVSQFTTVGPSILSYNLTIKIEKYGNETLDYLAKKYPNAYKYYYAGLRYRFYAEYFESHPEVEYAMFSDVDMLILKNPFYRKGDNNYLWAKVWIELDNNIKKSCGINLFNKSLDDPYILKQIPWNAGLMMGKAKNLLIICKFIANAFFCPGMFKDNAEQGLINYLALTGQIFTLGIKFRGHHVINGAFMSCPHSLNVNVFRQRIHSGQVFAIHHYQLLKSWYVSACYPQLIQFINY